MRKNVGFGQANNIGYQYSTGDFIFLLNSDTLLLNNAIKLFYDKMRILPLEIGCIGTMLVNGKGMNLYRMENFQLSAVLFIIYLCVKYLN